MKKKMSENKHFGPTFIEIDKWTDKYRLTVFLKNHWKKAYLTKLILAELGREVFFGEGPIYYGKSPEERAKLKENSLKNRLI